MTRSMGILKNSIALEALWNKNLNKGLRHLGMGLFFRKEIRSLPIKNDVCLKSMFNPS